MLVWASPSNVTVLWIMILCELQNNLWGRNCCYLLFPFYRWRSWGSECGLTSLRHTARKWQKWDSDPGLADQNHSFNLLPATVATYPRLTICLAHNVPSQQFCETIIILFLSYEWENGRLEKCGIDSSSSSRVLSADPAMPSPLHAQLLPWTLWAP